MFCQTRLQRYILKLDNESLRFFPSQFNFSADLIIHQNTKIFSKKINKLRITQPDA
jgi:hypothetical protein